MTKSFDERFDDGEDVSADLDFSRARRPGMDTRRVNVDFPVWILQNLDYQARRRGVTRQALIKMWVADRLEEAAKAPPPQ